MKKGIFLEGTLKLNGGLNKYFVDFGGINAVCIGNPRSFYASKPNKDFDYKFEYGERLVLTMPFVFNIFSEKGDVRDKSFDLLTKGIKMVKEYGLKGVVVPLKGLKEIEWLKELADYLEPVKDSVYFSAGRRGLDGDLDSLSKLIDRKQIIVDVANLWASSFDFNKGVEFLKDTDISFVRGSNTEQGSGKVKKAFIKSADNMFGNKAGEIMANTNNAIFDCDLMGLYGV